jgi:hypothetical protein
MQLLKGRTEMNRFQHDNLDPSVTENHRAKVSAKRVGISKSGAAKTKHRATWKIGKAIAGRERQIAEQPTNGVAAAHLAKLKTRLA